MVNKRIKKDLSKEEKISLEMKKYNEIFAKIDPELKKANDSLIENVVFMKVSLEELQKIINEKGYTEEYKNGANQYGIKKCNEVELYNTMIKNYMTAMKQLNELIIKNEFEEEDGFEDFLISKDK